MRTQIALRIQILANADAVANEAAKLIAAEARAAAGEEILKRISP